MVGWLAGAGRPAGRKPPPSPPPAPWLAQLQSTSLGIPENNAEVVAAVVASPAQDVSHVPEQVAPIAPVDVPHVPDQVAPIAPVDVPHVLEQVAPIAPVDVPHVPKQVAPIAPVADSSPGKVSVTSSQSACSVDLLGALLGKGDPHQTLRWFIQGRLSWCPPFDDDYTR